MLPTEIPFGGGLILFCRGCTQHIISPAGEDCHPNPNDRTFTAYWLNNNKNIVKNRSETQVQLVYIDGGGLELLTHRHTCIISSVRQSDQLVKLRIRRLHLLQKAKTPTKRCVLDMTLSCFRWWGSCSGDLRNIEYLVTAITPRSTLIHSGCIS